MRPLACSEITTSMTKYLEDQLLISTRPNNACVLTLPIKTLDGRSVSVIVEQTFEDAFIVHDGGKTDSELFSQGVKMNDSDDQTHAAIAAKYEVSIRDRMIQKVCRRVELNEAILTVGQCAAMMTSQLLWSSVEIEDDRVYRDVSAALTLWKPADVHIDEKVTLNGTKEQHTVGFVVVLESAHRMAAVDVLLSSRARALDRARKYDYTWMDMERKSPEYRNWARLAIIPSVEAWSPKALEIIRSSANEAIVLPSDQEATLNERISESMAKLAGPGFSPGERAPFALR
jgi:hypothetical protein